MDKEFKAFRKATFGGFNKKDVISYIEKMRNESYEYKNQVEETVKSLNEKIRELENAARLMEQGIAAAENTAEKNAQAEEYPQDIGQATIHLKTVADELCRSLGEFMEKLGQKGLFEKTEESEEEKELQPVEEKKEESLVDSILSSLDFLDEGEEVKACEGTEEKKAEKETVSDILSGLSFLA